MDAEEEKGKDEYWLICVCWVDGGGGGGGEGGAPRRVPVTPTTVSFRELFTPPTSSLPSPPPSPSVCLRLGGPC